LYGRTYSVHSLAAVICVDHSRHASILAIIELGSRFDAVMLRRRRRNDCGFLRKLAQSGAPRDLSVLYLIRGGITILLDDGTPSIARLEHLDTGICVFDACLEILAASEASNEEDTLQNHVSHHYLDICSWRFGHTVTPLVGRLIWTDLTWSLIRRMMSLIRGLKISSTSRLEKKH
jgi:hypothetical protein